MDAPTRTFLLSPRVLRALRSERRAQILKTLAERAHTPTELARRLDVSDATIREHLQILRDAGLVARRDDGRVWAYHELTPAGRDLIDGTARPSWTPALTGVLLAGLGAKLLARWGRLRPEPLPPGTISMPMAVPPDPSLPWLLGGGIAAFVLAAAALGWSLVAAWTARRLRMLPV